MTHLNALDRRMEALSHRKWDLPAIEKRFRNLEKNGIPKKQIDQAAILRDKEKFLDQVQTKAEEYCYLTRNCAKGSALALFEEFGLGNMEIIKALTPFPGLGMTGGICGPVTGGLVSIGLFFSDDDPANFENPSAYMAGRDYIKRFETIMGSLLCPKIQERILGKSYDPFSGSENREEYNAAGVREKCPLAPGFGARTVAEIIIEKFEKTQVS
ncbi:C-GCAxxG-C-C family protein [bacterium]|nr:C-GCAxxG-C-C family protein [bacterium]